MPETKKYLNRDGLYEYNSLLPHSSGEMQDYVDDWLDAHPEATTTVQDGAISEPKLADESVSLRTLADDTVHMLKGAILTGNLSGNVLSADDAYSAPPVALAIEGKSTQDGTPTPDAPVEIVSVEQVTLHASADGTTDAANWPVLLNLTHALRSLPDGTHDTLALSYLRPSTREGWAWYSRELVQKCKLVNLAELAWAAYSATCFRTGAIQDMRSATNSAHEVISDVFLDYGSSKIAWFNGHAKANRIGLNVGSKYILVKTGIAYESAADFKATLGNAIALYPLETPITTQLDPIELPILPAPNCTVWSDPTTGLQMSYVRDTNLVIAQLEAAYADLATS